MAKYTDRADDRSGLRVRTWWGEVVVSFMGVPIVRRHAPVSLKQPCIHVIALHNINSYGGVAECSATLKTAPYSVRFVSLTANPPGTVTPDKWCAPADLPPLGRNTLGHVGFAVTTNPTKDQNVDVAVEVRWASRFAQPATVRLSLEVAP